MAVMIAPSMLSADFTNLAADVEMVNNSEASLFHLDIMDGVFVPNISYGFPVVNAIASRAKKPLDAHLMIVSPERYIEKFASAGVSYLSVHYEACTHLHRTVYQIKDAGMKAGVVINPHTPVSSLEEIVADSDFILVMSVNPGFAAQKFIPGSLGKIEKLKELILKKSARCLIEVDGGITEENAPAIVKAGADILVTGNTVFGSDDPSAVISSLSTLIP
jgi:ribulose-phosphate 3-epimerase